MSVRCLTTRAAIGSLVFGFSVFTVGVGNHAIGSPPGGGGGRGSSAGNWVNFGIGAANAINRSRQQQQQQQPQHQPDYYPPQQLAAPVVTPTPAPLQANAIPERKVEPQKNVAPLTDKIVPLRRREARCYQHALAGSIDDAGQKADAAWQQHKKAIGEQLLKSLSKLVTDEAALKAVAELLRSGDFVKAREQIEGLKLSKEAQEALARNLEASQKIDQQMRELQGRLRENPSWDELQKTLEGMAAAISQLSQQAAANPQAPPRMDDVINGIGGLANLLIIRDILAQASNAEPPARFTPVPPATIPTGIIRVIYDPDLPVGAGLWINEGAMIAGTGGRGELQTGIASAAEALGLPVAPGDPIADLGKDENPPKGGILIGNPEENAGSIKYVLASVHPYELQKGFRQHLPGDQPWLIEFDRGGAYGRARYTLTEGIFDFKVGDKGWEMVTRPLKAVIDNRDGQHDFHYVEDNKRQTVKAGESKTIENKAPVVISFDAGKESASRKLLNKSGTYKVAVDIETNRYDLFAMMSSDSKSPVTGVISGGKGE